MNSQINWPDEFARVISCSACAQDTRGLLRDANENVPQPGYIGSNYWGKRILLVGQNPGIPNHSETDHSYTNALRGLRDFPTLEMYRRLEEALRQVIPTWPVHNNYFPLGELKLELSDIAYFNVVRCRTVENKCPRSCLIKNCIKNHFNSWLHYLDPRVVVFIGKWAANQVGEEVERRKIPSVFMNRRRNLSPNERSENRAEVVKFVIAHIP